MTPDVTEALRTRLRAWIVENLYEGQVPPGFDDATDLIAAGVMDSLAIMRTLAQLELAHGVRIDPGDIVPEHFASVAALAAFVAAKG
jgi:acyl carrier protein